MEEFSIWKIDEDEADYFYYLCEFLLKKEANVNATDIYGFTCLHHIYDLYDAQPFPKNNDMTSAPYALLQAQLKRKRMSSPDSASKNDDALASVADNANVTSASANVGQSLSPNVAISPPPPSMQADEDMKALAKFVVSNRIFPIFIWKAIGDAFCEPHRGLFQLCGKQWFGCDSKTGEWSQINELGITCGRLLLFMKELIKHLDDVKEKRFIANNYMKAMPFIRAFFHHDESSSLVFQRFKKQRLERDMVIAACGLSIKTVMNLHKKGVSLNAVSKNGYTPLFYACCFGQYKMFDYIMSQEGIVVNTKTNRGRTPLHAASEDVCLHHVERLIEAGADVTAISNDGDTVLHFASEISSGGLVVKKLMESGANAVVNKINNDGFTALMVASIKNCPETVKILIKGGADVSITREKRYLNDSKTGTALQMAKEWEGWENDLLLKAFTRLRDDEEVVGSRKKRKMG